MPCGSVGFDGAAACDLVRKVNDNEIRVVFDEDGDSTGGTRKGQHESCWYCYLTAWSAARSCWAVWVRSAAKMVATSSREHRPPLIKASRTR